MLIVMEKGVWIAQSQSCSIGSKESNKNHKEVLSFTVAAMYLKNHEFVYA